MWDACLNNHGAYVKYLVIMLCSAYTLLISSNAVVAYSLQIYQTTPLSFKVQDDCSKKYLIGLDIFSAVRI